MLELTPGICTQCGANISVDKTKQIMVCPYCNTSFIVKEATQNFSNIYNISTQNMYIKGNIENEFTIVAGVLTKYNGTSLHIKIPQNVKKIGDHVFEGLFIESVELHNDIIEIGNCSFKNCKKLKSFSFPPNIERLGSDTFIGCENLESIHVSSKSLGKVSFTFGYMSGSILINSCFKLTNIYIDSEKLQPNDYRLEFFPTTPIGYPYFLKNEELKQKKKEQKLIELRKISDRCTYCGGTFKLKKFKKRCSICQNQKNY